MRFTANVPRTRGPHINTVPGFKWCPHCARRQAVEFFGFDRNREDGLSGWCRACRAANQCAHRAANHEAYLAASRARYRSDPVKWHAKVVVARALIAGKLTKPHACPMCDRPRRLEAHHHLGYARENWLNIVWRCRQCHALEHKRGVA